MVKRPQYQTKVPKGMHYKKGDIPKDTYPQIGGPAIRYQVIARSGLPALNERGNPKKALKFPGAIDLGDEEQRAVAKQHLIHAVVTAPDQIVEAGKLWYPEVHEQVADTLRQHRGLFGAQRNPMLAGAAVQAGVSGNTDWDMTNQHILGQVARMGKRQWNEITGFNPRKGTYDPSNANLASLAGTPLAKSFPDRLVTVHRLLRGEDPDTVISSPKQHSFMHNIADPSDPHYVTVDARHFDIMTNRSRPFEYSGRNIGDWNRPSGNVSEYEHARDITQEAAAGSEYNPSEHQAIAWLHGKLIERTTPGRPLRGIGRPRRGQPYFHPGTGEYAYHLNPVEFGLTEEED